MRRFVAIAAVITILMVLNAGAATKYVCQSDGNDADDGSTAELAKATINAGIGVMAASDTLEICTGTYDELIIGSPNGTMTPPANILAVQPGTKIVPSGTSPAAKTRIVARAGATVGIKASFTNPETRSIVLFYLGHTQNVEFDGINFLMHGASDRTTITGSNGIFLGDSVSITIKNGDVKGGGIKASGASASLIIENMVVHDVGYPWCNFLNGDTDIGGPCPHGMYICGDNHTITGSEVHHVGHSGIHITCEQSNSDNVLVKGNRVRDLPGFGIIIDGANGKIIANRLERVGISIFPVSNTTKTLNNTISSYYTETPSYVPDPFSIMYFSAGIIRNNLILAPKSAFNTIQQQQFQAINTSQVHHNLCTATGNAGCTLTGTTANLVTDYASEVLTLKSTSPARGAGVDDVALTTDFVGLVYPSPPDIGAYAFSEGGDVTPPTVSITAPTGGATVSGTISITADASDDVGVAGVQFKVDGGNQGSEDLAAPYSTSWNTLAITNGTHVLTAVARDAAGNNTTSAQVSVTVDNPGIPVPGSVNPRATTMFFGR